MVPKIFLAGTRGTVPSIPVTRERVDRGFVINRKPPSCKQGVLENGQKEE